MTVRINGVKNAWYLGIFDPKPKVGQSSSDTDRPSIADCHNGRR